MNAKPEPAAARTRGASGSQQELLSQALGEVFDALTAGEAVVPEQLLERYPSIAAELSCCLANVDLIQHVGPQLTGEASAAGGSQIQPLATLGDFRIVRELGRGGMGVVYEAEQLSMGRTVALKVLPFAAVLDEKAITRFKNEARAAGTLHHPNIVPVHAVGNERGVYYYAMAFIDGVTLCQVIRALKEQVLNSDRSTLEGGLRLCDLATGNSASRSPLSAEDELARGTDGSAQYEMVSDRSTLHDLQAAVSTKRANFDFSYFEQVAQLAIQAGEAIHHAHEHGIVHRDIKPGNLMLDSTGKLWVTDFGLARMESEAGMTMTGDLVGTLRYMAPEQALAKRIVVDHRADIYSLGVTLYELLTMRPVFDGADREALLKQLAFDDPPTPHRLNPHLPADLSIIVTKAIAKNPDERYPTAAEMVDDLQRFVNHKPIRARRPSLLARASKWARRHQAAAWSTIAVLVLSMIGLAAGSVVVWREQRETAEALAAKVNALREKEAAFVKADAARERAEQSRQQAEAERQRAESNLVIAMTAVEELYLDSIGQDKLLRTGLLPWKLEWSGQTELTASERELVGKGMTLYELLAEENPTNRRARFETAKAYSRLGLLRTALDEIDAARAAYTLAIFRLQALADEEPACFDYVFELGTAIYQQGTLSRYWPDASAVFEQAEEAVSRAIELSPTNTKAYRLRGRVRLALGMWVEAVQDLQEVASLEPDVAQSHRDLATVLLEMKRPDAADHVRVALELDPQDVRTINLGVFIHRGKNPQAAISLLETALASASDPVEIASLRSRVLGLRGERGKQIELANQLLAASGENENFAGYRNRARAHLAVGDRENALQDLQRAESFALLEGGQHGHHLIALARGYSELGMSDRAMALANQAIELFPNNYHAYYQRSQFLTSKPYVGGDADSERNYQQALADLDRVVELNPNIFWQRKDRAVLLFNMGNFEQALKECAEMLETARKTGTDPELPFGRPELDACRDTDFRLGYRRLLSEALRMFSRRIEAQPDNSEHFAARAGIYYLLGEEDKALDNSGRAIELAPSDAGHRNSRGNLHRQLGRNEEALADFSRAIELQPSFYWPWANRGVLHFRLDNYEQAAADLDRAIALRPGERGIRVLQARAYASAVAEKSKQNTAGEP